MERFSGPWHVTQNRDGFYVESYPTSHEAQAEVDRLNAREVANGRTALYHVRYYQKKTGARRFKRTFGGMRT